jgi:hypothetical protein
MRPALAFLLGALVATLIWRPWSNVDHTPGAHQSEEVERESAPSAGRTPSVPSETSRSSGTESLPIAAAPSELAAEREARDSDAPPDRKLDDSFYRNLRGPERERFFAEHRWEYIKTHRDAVLLGLERLEAIEDPFEHHQAGKTLANTNIALLLDLQNRARAWEPGVKEYLDTGKDGWYSFISSNWVYRVNEDEFPEIAYFHGKPRFEVSEETGERV